MAPVLWQAIISSREQAKHPLCSIRLKPQQNHRRQSGTPDRFYELCMNALRDGAQDFITNNTAVTVVYYLEVIDVDRQKQK